MTKKQFEAQLAGRPVITDELMDYIEKHYERHHSSWHKEYVSRKIKGYAEPYVGRFGRGIAIHEPSWASTTYSYIVYYTIPED